MKHFPHLAHGNFLGRRYFLLSLYSTVINLLCTGTAAGLTSGGSLFGVGTVDVLGVIGAKAAFSAVGSSSGGGMSLPRDRSMAMAVFVPPGLHLWLMYQLLAVQPLLLLK